MAIGDRNLKVGTRLVARYRKNTYRAEVVAGEEGKVAYRMEDGRVFKTPSAAGSAVMGGHSCNGWAFWTVEGEMKAKPAKGGLTLTEPTKSEPTGETATDTAQPPTGATETATGAAEAATPPTEPTTGADAPTDAPVTNDGGEGEQEAHPAPKAKAKGKGKAKGGKGTISKADEQDGGVPEGEARYYCRPCDRFFLGSAAETPRACLVGHRAS